MLKKLWYAKAQINKNLKLKILNEGITLDELYNYSYEKLFSLGLSIKEADALKEAKDEDYLKKTINYLESENMKFIFITDNEYPELLKHIYKPPTGLFIKGKQIDLNNSIAIIGARRCSVYGKQVAKSISKKLSLKGITVVSGLALGVDAYAHIGAIEGNGLTAGVIGSGHMHTYPKTNKELYNEILKTGCVISEYFPEEPPLKHRFPERNRIISGITQGTVIVEAGERSGSLITANFALEQGKDVYAIPGNINSPTSIGCNKLIKEGAKVVTDINDILEDFDLKQEGDYNYTEKLEKDEIVVINYLREGNKSFEQMHIGLNIKAHKLLIILSKLECMSLVERVYGNNYCICQT